MTERKSPRRAFNLWSRSTVHVRREMDAEIDAHLQMRIDDLVRTGMPIDAAREEALKRFGDLTDARRQLYEGALQRNRLLSRRDRIGGMIADCRYAARQARRSPVFTAIAVAVVAIGIGMATVTLTLMERILLRPLPFPAEHQLISLGSVDSLGNGFPLVSSADWSDWTSNVQSLASTALYAGTNLGLSTAAGAINIPGQYVSEDFFSALRPRFIAGRSFTADEVRTNDAVAVISESLWRREFSADSSLRALLRIADNSYRVIGVVADGQAFPAGTDVWIGVRVRNPGRNNINWQAIARLADNATVARARAELAVNAAAVRAANPDGLYSWGVDVKPLKQLLVGDARRYLVMLVLASALVLLIACANVAAANLGRSAVRMREFAVRSAIGAGRGRLVQQLLIEHVGIAVVSGLLGIALAWISLRVVVQQWGSEIPRVAEVQLDSFVLLAAFALSAVAGTLTRLLPALVASRTSLTSLLSSGSHGSARGGRSVSTRLLVATQIATAVVLVTGSTLLLRSFRNVLSRDLGFNANVVTVKAMLSTKQYLNGDAPVLAYWSRLQQVLMEVPGVREVALTNRAPLIDGGQGFIDIENVYAPGASAGYRAVSGNYFEAIGTPLRRGRSFSTEDVAGAERVAVVNESMAHKYWPGRNPIGRRVRANSMEGWITKGGASWIRIVGVVGDVRHYGFESEATPEMFVHYLQVPLWARSMTAIVRPATGRAEALRNVVHRQASQVDASIAVDVSTLNERVSARLAERTMIMSMISVYGVVALVLAALGTYGMLAYTVARRMRELAVRTALGATRMRIVSLVLTSAGQVAALGIVAGVAASFALAHLLDSYLVDIAARDASSIVLSAAILGIIALVASLPSAIRASRVNPLAMLREE